MPVRCTFGLAALAGLLLVGCNAADPYGSSSAAEIHFNDDAPANAAPGDAILNLTFVDAAGNTIRPRDFTAKHHNLVLVFTRGYNGSICPYCSSYTSGLISNYPAIAARETDVLVVYPIAKPDQSRRLSEFLQATFEKSESGVKQTPFPVVLDIGLKAVDALGIRKDLAKPATYILDKQGQVRYAHVGSTLSDRPSIKMILKQLDGLKQEPG